MKRSAGIRALTAVTFLWGTLLAHRADAEEPGNADSERARIEEQAREIRREIDDMRATLARLRERLAVLRRTSVEKGQTRASR